MKHNMFKRHEVLLIICIITVLGLFLIQLVKNIVDSPIIVKSTTLKMDFLPCEKDDELLGFVDTKGLFYPSHGDDNVTPVINGYCVIDGTLYKVGNTPSDTIPIFRDLESHGIMNDGLIPVCKENEYITIVDSDGKEAFQLQKFDDKEVVGCFSYSDSKLRIVLEDGSIIYVDKEGHKLFDRSYSWATDFKHGYAVVQATNQNENLYSLIDGTDTPLFTFECEDKDKIVVSYDLKYLSSRENKKIIIYDFSGKRVLECPAKVCGIYAFCQDGFIFYNDDDKWGVMTYKGEMLIRPRYEQIVPHYGNYLVCTDDDIVKLVNKKETIIKEYDGEEILDFLHEGYDFPNVIKTPNDDFMIVDADGNLIVEDIDIDYDQDDIEEMTLVRSDYFPADEILNTIIELCGDGTEVSGRYGAFFNHQNSYCAPKHITFISNLTLKDLTGKYSARKNINMGANFDFSYGVLFNEPIVLHGGTELNNSASLLRVELNIRMLNKNRSIVFSNRCIETFRNIGCEISGGKNGNYLVQNNNLLYAVLFKEVVRGEEYEFSIIIMQNNEFNRSIWESHIKEIS